jgi:hypothetical protein
VNAGSVEIDSDIMFMAIDAPATNVGVLDKTTTIQGTFTDGTMMFWDERKEAQLFNVL